MYRTAPIFSTHGDWKLGQYVHLWYIVHKQPEFENYLDQMYPAEL